MDVDSTRFYTLFVSLLLSVLHYLLFIPQREVFIILKVFAVNPFSVVVVVVKQLFCSPFRSASARAVGKQAGKQAGGQAGSEGDWFQRASGDQFLQCVRLLR